MKKSGKKYVLLVVLILLVAAALYFIFIKKDERKNGDNPNQTQTKELAKGLTKEDASKLEKGFYVYYDKNDEFFCIYNDRSKCSDKRIFIKTETDDTKAYFEYEDKYYFYKDNGKIKVYDNDAKESYIIDIKDNYFSYNFEVDDVTKEFVGIIYNETDESDASYYSVIDGKIIYDQNYSEMTFLSKDYLMGTTYNKNVNPWIKTEISLLSAKQNKKLKSYNVKKNQDGYYESNIYYQLLRNEKGTFITLSTFVDATIYKEIYNTKFEKLAENIGEFSATISSLGNLYIEKNGVVTAYDKDGNEVKKSQKYNALQVIDDYIVALVDNKLVLITLDGNQIELAAWDKSKNEYAHYRTYMRVEKGKHKIYIAVKDKNVTVDEAWEACKKDSNCNIERKEDIANYYDCGYLYYYVKETKEVGKQPSYM